ncbi:cupin domain-containing protein [Ovoidimarina sediminis]|uniref:cupin domain-containing protein n=1 Tax=Ovoidimarina sediminis TaxID=3079856 RepID=UPI00290F2719|nr:cupin domain-containing protein [Rhodophyticola sp. MJ-SS7]MDU8943646.1 cupin domain-containing protein [Rhodophyticola sp. MJ-SS7]
MTAISGIIRFETDGPDGLQPIELDPDDFETMPEAQNLHVYFEDPDLGMSVGVWDTTPMQERFGPYPGDEFILVLDGSFDMMDTVDGSGVNVPCRKGQSVIFRNGVPVSWKQHDYLRKLYITYTDPRAEMPAGLTAEGGIQALDPDMTLTDADRTCEPGAIQRDRILFRNDHGNFEVGLWDTEPIDTELSPFPWHEFCQVLDGEVTITEAGGRAQTFTTGDVFFVPAGTVCAWKVPRYLRKYYAALNPAIRPGG